MSVVDLPFDATLDDLEAIVASGIGAFVEVGLALAEIRDRRLYLDSHETFDGYCRERWGMERTYAHRNIEAAQVASMLPIGNRPANEAQARELARLDPEEVAEVWGDVVEATDNRPTAAAVRKVVDQALGIEPTPEPEPAQTVTGTDGKNYRVPQSTPRPKRSSLVDAARNAGWEFRKATERLERIASDDRFTANREQVAEHVHGHLLYAIEVCQDLVNRLERPSQ